MKHSCVSVLIAAVLAAAVPALAQDTVRTGYVNSQDGVPIFFTTQGEGDAALVFIHGWTCDGTFWDAQAEAFADRGYESVSVDLGGHGRSGKNRTTWSMASFGDDVVAVADSLGLERMILVGHSMGGTVAIDAAEKLGHRVEGVVLVDSFRDPDERMPQEEIDGFVRGLREDFRGFTGAMVRQYMFAPETDSAFVERITDHMSGFDPEIGTGSIEQLFQADYRDAMRRLRVPIIAINAGYMPTNVDAMAAYGIEVSILPGTGHFLMMEQPKAFNTLLTDALETL